MISVKRILCVGVPAAVLALGVTVYAQSRSNDCAHPTLLAKAMQATGMGKIQLCEVTYVTGGPACVDPGRHCNVGNGAGKCQNASDPDTGNISGCECVPNH